MPKRPHVPDERDAKIRRLEDALYLARTTIVQLMPENARKLLEAGLWCSSTRDIAAWQSWAISELVEQAVPLSGAEAFGQPGAARAYCPLCGGGALSGGYTQGFKLPAGLERHLEGSHGSRRCPVFAAAIEPCFERVREHASQREGVPRFSFEEGVRPWEIETAKAVMVQRPSAVIIKLRRDQ